MLPPLFADLIRQGLTGRVGALTVAEFADIEDAAQGLRASGADLVIVGPSAQPADAIPLRKVLPDAPILRMLQDLTRFVDLDTGVEEEFTLDALAARLPP